MMSMNEKQATIMVVDDTPANLELLEGILRGQNYAVRSFPRGRMALRAASTNPPDLILLDINMPEMNGYEVCEQLKANPALAPIPVIFLSAMSETPDKIRAFQCGGVDYVTKPFQVEEVLARVDTHVRLCRLRAEVERQNQKLEELVRLRTRQLAEAHERLFLMDRTKSDFLAVISHELRTPMNGLFGIAEMVFEECRDRPELQDCFELYALSRRRLVRILEDAVLLSQMEVSKERFGRAPEDFGQVLAGAIERTREFAAGRQVYWNTPLLNGLQVLGEKELLEKALAALLETAVKFSEPGRTVDISFRNGEGSLRLTIDACGLNIPDTVLPRFFEVMAISESMTPGGDLGLAPAVAERIVKLFGGSVDVENRHPPGIRLTVNLRTA